MNRKMLEEKISEYDEGDAGQSGTSRNESLETRIINFLDSVEDLESTLDDDGNGRGESTLYYKNGNKALQRKGSFKECRLNGRGEITFYYENGNKKTEDKGIFKDDRLNGRGKRSSYNQDGNKEREEMGIFKNGLLNGKGRVIFYHENEGVVEECKGTFKNGQLNGRVEIMGYYGDGSHVRGEGIFEEGRLKQVLSVKKYVGGEVVFEKNAGRKNKRT